MALVLLVTACRPEVRPAGLTLLIESPPDSLDNRLALSANGERLAQLIAPGLVTFDEAGRAVPDLAVAFAWLDPVTLEVRLRQGLVFHGGAPLTAADVVATYQGILSGAAPSAKREKYACVRSVEAVDPLTVRFHLHRPHAPLLTELTLSVLPESRAQGPGAAEQALHPLGAGPFAFEDRPDEDHVDLVAFARYYAGAPKVPALHVRVVRDETTRVLELLKGRADLTVNSISPELLPSLEERGLRVLTVPGNGFAYLGFNVRSGPLADVRVRRALCHLVDVAPILTFKFHGLARAATGLLAPDHWAYAPTPGCHRDVSLARQLLAQAGVPGLHLTLKTSTDRFRRALALVVKDQWAQGDVDLDVRAEEFGTLLDDARQGRFEVLMLKWSSTLEPDLMRQVFASSEVPSAANHFGGLNRGGYTRPALDEVLTRAAAAPQPERAALYQAGLMLLDEDVPVIPLWHEDLVAVLSSRVRHFAPAPNGFWTGIATAELSP